MEELNERVSAILDSPVLRYTWHKTYRQKSILCLVYLLYFYSFAFAGSENTLNFEPYQKKADGKIELETKSNKAGKKYISSSDNLKSLKKSAEAMAEVEEILDRLEISIKDLAETKPPSDEDREAILKAFAELDGVLSYTHLQLKSGKEQLTSIKPVTDEEVAEYNSLKVKFMSYMKLCRDLKMFIAEKLANASKRNTK